VTPTVANEGEGAIHRPVVRSVCRDGQNIGGSGGPNFVLGFVERFLPATENCDLSTVARVTCEPAEAFRQLAEPLPRVVLSAAGRDQMTDPVLDLMTLFGSARVPF
jgi:hypothetical protein